MENPTYNILLVEDNPADIAWVEDTIGKSQQVSFQVTIAEQLSLGLRFIDHQPFDLILLDLNLINSPGLETFHQVHQQAPQIPILILSDLQNETAAIEAVQAGAEDYVLKEYLRDGSLVRTIRHTIERYITYRKMADEALYFNQSRYRALFNQTHDAIFILDLEGKHLEVNQRAADMLGYQVGEVHGLSFNETSAEIEKSKEVIRRLKAGEHIPLYERLFRKKDGSTFPVEINVELVRDSLGNPLHIQSVVRDISERKRSEEALKISESKLRAILENSRDAIGVHVKGIWEMCNPAALKLFGVSSPQQLIGTPILNVIAFNERARISGYVRNRMAGMEAPSAYLTRGLRNNGSEFDMEVTVSTFVLNGTDHVLVILRDITERKMTEKLLHIQESRFRALIENSHDGVILVDLKGVPSFVSKSATTILGRSEIELLNSSPLTDFIHPDDRPQLEAAVRAWLQRGSTQPLRSVDRHLHANGTWLWLEIVISNMTADPSVGALVINFRDITERKQTENELQQSEEKFRSVIEYATNGVVVTDEQGIIVEWNSAIENMMGVTKEEALGQALSDVEFKLSPPERRTTKIKETIEEIIHKVLASGEIPENAHEQEYALQLPDGSERNLHLSSFVIKTPRGFRLAGISQDITQRKQAEEALKKAHDELEQRVIERTADLSQTNSELDRANIELKHANRLKNEFLASMSHELRTPLTGILGLSESLQMKTYGDLSEKQLKAVHNIEISGQHLLTLINDILDLSKIEAGRLEIQFEKFSLADLCQASLQMTKDMAQKKRQQVSFAMTPAAITLVADARRLKQMVVNLLSNAIKFTPEGGRLGLEVQGDEAAHLVKFVVWDKGIGIKPEDIQQLFRPFTQLDGRLSRQYNGAGLGLSLVKRMAELQGGNVEVESVFGEGSRFTIIMPWKISI